MASQVHRRHVLLFLAAILLPSAALIGLGLRLVVQERELDAARLADDRRRTSRELKQELISRLEAIAIRQVTTLASRPGLLQAKHYDDASVELVARASGGALVLPWENDNRPADLRRLLAQGTFGQRLRQAEDAEFANAQPENAEPLYREAVAAAIHPQQAAAARLALARVLTKTGRAGEALTEYRNLSAGSAELVDEHGIPIALYAARQLLKQGAADEVVSGCLRRVLAGERWLSPPALYLLRDLAIAVRDRATSDDARRDADVLMKGVAAELSRTERAVALESAFPRLGLTAIDPTRARLAGAWVPHGDPAWLVGVAPAAGDGQPVVVAVALEPLLASLEARTAASSGMTGEIALAAASTADTEPLDPELPGLVVRFSRAPDRAATEVGNVRSWLYAAALCLVIGIMLSGAYLFWRDVRREVRLAEMRSSFVSAVSHELKTPLTAIRMFAETLRIGRPTDAGTRDEYLDTIVNESERLTRLLNNVLDFSKIEQGAKRYSRASHSLADIVRSAARAMQYPLEQQQFVLRTEIEDNLPPALVDRDAIEQAILNLLANAMKYSGESRDIEMRLRSQDGFAVVEVSDRGPGIEPAEQSRIFERFYRVSGPENDRIPGTGLGLTLVQHIAEGHGGRVTVRSARGEGSTFSLFIPLEKTEP